MTIKTLSWIIQIIVVVLVGQTLYFKFTDHPDTVALFEILGMGAVGYKLIGTLELIACILLLVRGGIVYGALLACALMTGAIIGHITEIGFNGKYGQLGVLAIVVWLLCLVILWLRRKEIPFIKCIYKKDETKQ
ncbi:hypothetical protein OAB00_00515 [Akkermansiaceae bacterium]|nr:hypothetical protein [Akkermansiaceae bacterium]